VFENRVSRRIFEPKRDKVIREWRKLHNVTSLNHAAGLHCMNSSSLAGKNKPEDQNTRTIRH
jgi:hypothetical protein